MFHAIKDLAEQQNLPYTGVIDRPDLQEILLENMIPNTVKNSMAIRQYFEHEDGTVDIVTEDGQEFKGFDVLIGADGIWSNIRAQMWGEVSARPGSATYSGYTLFAAETIMPPDSDFFKDEGYFEAGYKVILNLLSQLLISELGVHRAWEILRHLGCRQWSHSVVCFPRSSPGHQGENLQ